jgi:formamidopyrimidine-DNA glycosylase
MVCRLVDPRDIAEITTRLGPDPLRSVDGAGEFIERLRRRRLPVAAALLDQRIIAGIGNVFRAEFLFTCGIDPRRPAADISVEEASALWSAAVEGLRLGERMGRIVTVSPVEVGERRRSAIPADLRLYVYQRGGEPCRRCGTLIRETRLGGRRVWWCPRCQPR